MYSRSMDMLRDLLQAINNIT